jgi:toxin-antitoxin system PIN domain toxin
MSDLLDANVWVALVAADHVHHERALHYWQAESAESVAFCRITALAFLRLVTNAHIMQHAVLTSGEAWALLQEWIALPEVSVLNEPVGLDEQLGQFSRVLSIRPKLWTDAYLAAFAMAGNHRIVTFDGDFQKFPGLNLLLLQPKLD